MGRRQQLYEQEDEDEEDSLSKARQREKETSSRENLVRKDIFKRRTSEDDDLRRLKELRQKVEERQRQTDALDEELRNMFKRELNSTNKSRNVVLNSRKNVNWIMRIINYRR